MGPAGRRGPRTFGASTTSVRSWARESQAAGGGQDTGDNPLAVPDLTPPALPNPLRGTAPAQILAQGWAGTRGPAQLGTGRGLRCCLPCPPPPSAAGRFPVPAAMPRAPGGGPPAGRGVPGGAQSTVRLLGWISRLITARLRARWGAIRPPATCPTWAPPMALSRLPPGTSAFRWSPHTSRRRARWPCLPWMARHGAAETHPGARPWHGSAPAAGSTTALSCLIRGRCSRARRAKGCRALHPRQGPCPAVPADGSRSLFSYK